MYVKKIPTSKLIKCWISIVIFQYHLVRWCKLQIHAIGRASDLGVGVCTHDINKKVYMTHMGFPILNSHITVTYLKFIKSTNLYVVKQKNLFNCILPCYLPLYYKVPFLKQKNVSKIKWLLSVNLTSKNLLKKFWPCQFFYYMKSGLSASMFCQI